LITILNQGREAKTERGKKTESRGSFPVLESSLQRGRDSHKDAYASVTQKSLEGMFILLERSSFSIPEAEKIFQSIKKVVS